MFLQTTGNSYPISIEGSGVSILNKAAYATHPTINNDKDIIDWKVVKDTAAAIETRLIALTGRVITLEGFSTANVARTNAANNFTVKQVYNSAPTFTPGSNELASVLYSETVATTAATTAVAAKVLSGSATLDFPSTLAQSTSGLSVTVTGAAVGDAVAVGFGNASFSSGQIYTAYVSATDTVIVVFLNASASTADPASAVFNVRVIK
jgi:hypothetical protein